MAATLSKLTTLWLSSYFVVYSFRLKLIFFYNSVVYYYTRIFLILLPHIVYIYIYIYIYMHLWYIYIYIYIYIYMCIYILPPITKTTQVRRTRRAGHNWRSRDELMSDVLQWTPTYGRAKAGRPTRTYIQQLCEDTGCSPEDLPEAMNDREKWRERVRDIRAGGTTWWWWWWYIYIYIYIYIRNVIYKIWEFLLNSKNMLGFKFTYQGSSVESTEKDIDTRLTKAWTAINRLSITWKSDLTDKMKRSFLQAAVTSILLYGCTTWTLTKQLEKKLDGNYTRMLRAILNKSWRQHPTRHQLYGHLTCRTHWRSRDELIRDVLLWTPTHSRAKAGRPARTYIQQLCEDTGCCPEDLPGAMNDRVECRERVMMMMMIISA